MVKMGCSISKTGMSIINQIRRYYDVLLKIYRSYGHFCIPREHRTRHNYLFPPHQSSNLQNRKLYTFHDTRIIALCIYIYIYSLSNLSDGRSNAAPKTVPPHSAM